MSDPDHDSVEQLPPNLIGLEDLLSSINESVARVARQGAAQAMDHMLKHCFTVDPQTGRAEARTMKLPVPAPNGTPIDRDIPLYRMIPQRDTAIEQVVLRLPVWVKSRHGVEHGPEIAVSLEPPGHGSHTHTQAELEIRFRGIDPTEGIEQAGSVFVKRSKPETA